MTEVNSLFESDTSCFFFVFAYKKNPTKAMKMQELSDFDLRFRLD